MSVLCEHCYNELTHLEVDHFDWEGADSWVDVPISEHINGAFIDLTPNWVGHDFDDDDEEKHEVIRCPYCHNYPFADEEIQTYEYDRVVMFHSKGGCNDAQN